MTKPVLIRDSITPSKSPLESSLSIPFLEILLQVALGIIEAGPWRAYLTLEYVYLFTSLNSIPLPRLIARKLFSFLYFSYISSAKMSASEAISTSSSRTITELDPK
jgi:hypothetical protein